MMSTTGPDTVTGPEATTVDPPAADPPALTPRLLTVPDAARLLGVGRTTAYELIAAGDLEVVHIGRSARVPTPAIDAFVDRLRARNVDRDHLGYAAQRPTS